MVDHEYVLQMLQYDNYDLNIFLVSLLAAPEGIKNIQKKQKGIHIFTCNIDAKLNKNKFIVPGLGDAGDRYMGT